MPLFSEPSTMLSRVAPHEACLATSTSGMPCLAKRPFSLAMTSGGSIDQRDVAEDRLGDLGSRRGLREGAGRECGLHGRHQRGRRRGGGRLLHEIAPADARLACRCCPPVDGLAHRRRRPLSRCERRRMFRRIVRGNAFRQIKKPQPKARELRPPQVSGVACGGPALGRRRRRWRLSRMRVVTRFVPTR